MAFGWFAKGKNTSAKSLQKAHKLASQARWAEALSYYEDAMAESELAAEAGEGARACRGKLVQWNLEEAEAFRAAEEPQRAREHVELALELAGDEEDLVRRARSQLELTAAAETVPSKEAPTRLFEPRCGCPAPCPPGAGGSEAGEEHTAGEELFEFYLDSLSPAERSAFEGLDSDFRQGFVLLQQGETAAARPLLEAVAAGRSDVPGLPYALGLLEAVEGRTTAAADRFRRTLEVDPDFAPAAHHIADLMREEDRAEEAAAFLAPWCDAHPEDGEALYLLAVCKAESGDRTGALETLDRAQDIPDSVQSRVEILRAGLLQREGDDDAALEAYRKVAARNPNLLEALVPMGQLLLDRGGSSAEKAAEVFKHCRRLDPDRGWWHLLRIAECYGVRGWNEEARDLLATARDELPDAPEPRAEWERIRKKLS